MFILAGAALLGDNFKMSSTPVPVDGSVHTQQRPYVRWVFVDEHETSNIFFLNSFHKQATQFYHAFGGADAFFLRPQPRRVTACHTAVRCNDGPPAATKA